MRENWEEIHDLNTVLKYQIYLFRIEFEGFRVLEHINLHLADLSWDKSDYFKIKI